MARLPKADNAIIAEHEAGKHDVNNGGYPTKGPQPETCRECAREAKETAASVPTYVRTGLPVNKPKAPKAEAATAEPILVAGTIAGIVAGLPGPKAKRVNALPGTPGPRSLAKLLVVTPPKAKAAKAKVLPGDAAKARRTTIRAKGAAKAEPVTIAKPPATSILGAIVVPEGGYGTREAWMLAAVEAIRPWFTEEGETLPPVRISIGWPGGRGNKQNVLGQCWAASAVDDGVPAIFVTPTQKDAVEVLETIIHEAIHAAGHMHHRSPFQKVARKFGFVNGGKTKTTREQSPDLYATLDEMAAALGPFPHAAVNGSHGLGGGDPKAPPVQGTRMLKTWCDNDGYTVRATKKWLAIAVPNCPLCESVMTVDWK